VRTPSGQRVSCWLHRLDDLAPHLREPLERAEVAIADEA
jgi:hypothetical protein